MQTINVFIRADSAKGTLVDSYNSTTNSLPTIIRGMEAQLILTLFSGQDTTTITQAELSDFTTWRLFADSDYSDATTVKLAVEPAEITVGEDGKITVQFLETNTEQLAVAIGTSESISLVAELLGYKIGETNPSFALHFPIRVLNRVWIDGAPGPDPITLEGEVQAALASMFSTLQSPSTIDELFAVVDEIVSTIKGGE